jgi:hypothetical protein
MFVIPTAAGAKLPLPLGEGKLFIGDRTRPIEPQTPDSAQKPRQSGVPRPVLSAEVFVFDIAFMKAAFDVSC